ncbi:hypothetical protein HUG17_10056 [Dermatophagoides farinae]|uniref:Platelet-derived growth factor (PDGF) family profile domain-containing protein n=1 Tax=Dermatophagoides farinae TaxID=6954 RepID=A0A9D4P260_DERFA|nr:hypothetical protein HUG17_10056 [Dermatophagoides farinae]
MNMMRTLAQKAYEHGIRINEEAQCSKPRAELIYLNDSKKIYLPRATLLYRCSDLTGCCPHATHSCEPSRVEKVTLYFFVIGVPQSSSSTMMIRRNQNIEQLTFINHTECACKPIDTMWSLEKLNTAVDVTMNGQNDSIQQQQQQQQIRNIHVSASDHDHVTYYIASNNQQQQQQQLNNVHNNDKIIYTLDDYY